MKKAIIIINYIIILAFITACNKKSKTKSIEPLSFQYEIMDIPNSKLVNLEKFKNFHRSIIRLENTNYTYQDKERKNFKRFPGNRNGIQLNKFSTEQRIQFQDLLNDILSPKGYLKILSILTNEDAPARTDDELGREKYWVTFFGVPNNNQNWGFRFEGHHISLNFSFRGNLLISNTPSVYGAFPSIIKKSKYVVLNDEDFYREGFNILFEEEDKGLALIASFDSIQHRQSYTNLNNDIDIIGEDNEIYNMDFLYNSAFAPEGILYNDLNLEQQHLMLDLINCYFSNFTKKLYDVSDLKKNRTKFITTGKIKKNDEYYYRIVNKDFLIEFQNIGNHIHCLFRDFRNDFGNEK